MPNWGEVLQEIQKVMAERAAQANRTTQEASQHQASALPFHCINVVKTRYLLEVSKHTGRNVIAHYSGFLSKPSLNGSEINDEDKNGFMMTIHKLHREKGLDLILHTPGGGIASTQSIVDYLHQMFRLKKGEPPNIRAIVPQIAMSAGTMIACSCREILMGKHSNLGPIDPQMRGIPAYGVLKEFETACKAVRKDPSTIPIWQSIISKYHPTFLSQCENAIDQSNTFVAKQLANVMFKGQPGAHKKAAKIVKALSHYSKNKTHDRHIPFDECQQIGLNIQLIEDAKDGNGYKDDKLQDLILTVHHCYMHLMQNTNVFKSIDNHNGVGISKQQALAPPGKLNNPQSDFSPVPLDFSAI
jgi:ClpP class serine protease